MTCSACGSDIVDGKSFCADCGSRILPPLPTPDITVTVAAAAVTGTAQPTTPSHSRTSGRSRPSALSDSSVDEGRYLPGTMLLDRYRITGMIGRGGMGEVYRATDLKLGQQVALKFLPSGASDVAINRFRAEVRIARQISHRNVCRVYDIGEVDGTWFLSMEYIQGEDLSSLLRRIGRVPGDKALEMARQICAGLAAAHEKGVLHRDLKPSNLLVDGEGSVVIVDFGLAAAEEIRAGTPAYMAPEQLEGLEVTVRSDIYSLGLVLYELFSGHRALNANSVAELQELHHSTPSGPSTFVRDIDPAVERVILQCLSPEPDLRPQTAAAVAAALPGGDALAAAMAAGETPSPAVVAAAGRAIGITPVQALVVTVLILVGMVGVWTGLAAMNDMDAAGADRSPEIMADRSRTLLQGFGFTEKPTDEMYEYRASSPYFQYVREPAHRATTFPGVYFYYRSSREQLTNLDPTRAGIVLGAVTHAGPPQTQSGMMWMQLTPRGQVLRFQYVTPEREPEGAAKPVDWPAVLRQAGYDPALFSPVKSEWLPDGVSDERVAWTGKDPSLTNIEVRLEAAAWKGRVVFFLAATPWVTPMRQPRPEQPGQMATQFFSLAVLVALLASAGWMARRNLLAGRGDRRGAWRLATALFVLHMMGFAAGADHVRSQAEIPLVGIAIALGLLKSALLWIGYIALEPITRRRWPHALISWARLLEGRWKDPLVGRDVLFGFFAAVLTGVPLLVFLARERALFPNGNSLPSPIVSHGLLTLVGGLLNGMGQAILSCLATFLILFLLRLILRRDWMAVLLCGLLFGVPAALNAGDPLAGYVFGASVNLLAFFVAARFGLTSLYAFLLGNTLFYSIGASMDFSLWYAANSLVLYATLGVATLLAFRSALAGRAVFGDTEVTKPGSA